MGSQRVSHKNNTKVGKSDHIYHHSHWPNGDFVIPHPKTLSCTEMEVLKAKRIYYYQGNQKKCHYISFHQGTSPTRTSSVQRPASRQKQKSPNKSSWLWVAGKDRAAFTQWGQRKTHEKPELSIWVPPGTPLLHWTGTCSNSGLLRVHSSSPDSQKWRFGSHHRVGNQDMLTW